MNENLDLIFDQAKGKEVTAIRRIFYVFAEVPNTKVGALELHFGDARILVDSGPDGEVLRVTTDSWRDPFEGNLSQENRDFIRESGKWTAVDVSDWTEYRPFINTVIDTIKSIKLANGKVIGLKLHTVAGSMQAQVEADDLYVQFELRAAG